MPNTNSIGFLTELRDAMWVTCSASGQLPAVPKTGTLKLIIFNPDRKKDIPFGMEKQIIKRSFGAAETTVTT